MFFNYFLYVGVHICIVNVGIHVWVCAYVLMHYEHKYMCV